MKERERKDLKKITKVEVEDKDRMVEREKKGEEKGGRNGSKIKDGRQGKGAKTSRVR